MSSGKMRVLALLGATLLMLALCGGVLASGHEAEGAGVTSGQIHDFILRSINFGIMVILLIVLLRKPLGAAMGARTEGIAKELEELNQRKEEAAKELAEVERRLRDAVSEREAVLVDFRAQGEKERDRIVAAAHTLAKRIKEQAQFTIEQETNQAKNELRREIADMSAAVAEDLLKRKITAEDQGRLVNEYLTKVAQEVQ